jgi:hypothetical protein
MFSLFITPFDVRNNNFTFAWVMCRAIYKNPEIILISPKNYWENFNDYIAENAWMRDLGQPLLFKVPSGELLSSLNKFALDYSLIAETAQKHIGPGITWAKTITERSYALERAVQDAIEMYPGIKAIFLWSNCASVSAVAEKLGIVTIHHELGPLRAPHYLMTAYLDFRGVNGNTDCLRRWNLFKASNLDYPVLSRSALLRVVSQMEPIENQLPSHEVGVALQVPDDSNMLAFSNGFTNYEAIVTADRYLGGRHLVRPHPGQRETFPDLPVDWDDSPSGTHFLGRINAVVTVNSSLAFEAMLMGKPTYVLGESPFKAGSWDITSKRPRMNDEEMTKWLNWIVFGYLIPYDLTFDSDYVQWRMSNPNEIDIYLENFRRWSL